MVTKVKKLGSPTLLFNQAQKMGMDPMWLTPKRLFAIKTPQGERYVNNELSSLNSHVSISLARNKYYTRLILDRHNLPNIPYARPKTMEAAESFLSEHGIIIVKPLRGAGAVDIHIVNSVDQLRALNIDNQIFEKYLPGREIRYLVLNDSVIGVHESKYGVSVDEHRELERVSFDSDAWDAERVEMSIRICKIIGLSFAAVDFIIDEKGQQYVLEVNSAPGFKWFHSPSSGPVVDVARHFLEGMIADQATR
jgi:glutathione synthase/RimK-type ligase-like ATP-grasp enzyme